FECRPPRPRRSAPAGAAATAPAAEPVDSRYLSIVIRLRDIEIKPPGRVEIENGSPDQSRMRSDRACHERRHVDDGSQGLRNDQARRGAQGSNSDLQRAFPVPVLSEPTDRGQ